MQSHTPACCKPSTMLYVGSWVAWAKHSIRCRFQQCILAAAKHPKPQCCSFDTICHVQHICRFERPYCCGAYRQQSTHAAYSMTRLDQVTRCTRCRKYDAASACSPSSHQNLYIYPRDAVLRRCTVKTTGVSQVHTVTCQASPVHYNASRLHPAAAPRAMCLDPATCKQRAPDAYADTNTMALSPQYPQCSQHTEK
jgi:hypothetical protein